MMIRGGDSTATRTLLLLLSALALTLTTADRGSSRSLLAKNSDAVTVNLIHFNDVHNRIEAQTSGAAYCSAADDTAGKCFGGFARLRSVIRYAKSLDPTTLVLDAGDEFVGSMYDSLYKGSATANLESLYGVDVMTVGNHEFDFGPSVLGDFIRRVNFPVLGACNIDASKEPTLAGLMKKYVVKEVKGIKIAFYGILINETKVTSSPGPNVEFSDPTAGLVACMKEANKEYRGIHLHVGLTHIGYSSDLLLATQVPGLDLIIGAHSHTFLYTGKPPLLTAGVNTSHDVVEGPYPTFVNYTSNGRTKTVPIVTAYFASRYVGVLSLQVDKKRGGLVVDPSSGLPLISGQPFLMGGRLSSSTVAQDTVMADLVGLYSKQVSTYSETIIGTSLVELDNTATRYSESPIGVLSCDAFLNMSVCNGCHIDFCILNSGTIRAPIDKVGGGLRYVYDGRRPVGRRILSVTTSSGQALDPCGQYIVLTNSYQATGGDGFAFMNDSPRLELYGRTFDAVLIEYVGKYSPVLQMDASPSPREHPPALPPAPPPPAPACTRPLTRARQRQSGQPLAAPQPIQLHNRPRRTAAGTDLHNLLMSGAFPGAMQRYLLPSDDDEEHQEDPAQQQQQHLLDPGVPLPPHPDNEPVEDPAGPPSTDQLKSILGSKLKQLGSLLEPGALLRPHAGQGPARAPMDPEVDAPLCHPIVPDDALLKALFPAAAAAAAGPAAVPAPPPGPHAWWPSCMLVDRSKVALHGPGVSLHRPRLNYLKQQLGRVHKRPACEFGHRIVLWCMLGPPPPVLPPGLPPAVPMGVYDPVVMHVCNRPSCHNALHTVWGERWENSDQNSNRSYRAALRRWKEQWGGCFDV